MANHAIAVSATVSAAFVAVSSAVADTAPIAGNANFLRLPYGRPRSVTFSQRVDFRAGERPVDTREPVTARA